MPEQLLDGFEPLDIELGGVRLRGRIGGEGPPLLLLHGFPQTHFHWHRLAPRLAGRFRLIMPDLPGYSASIGRAPEPDHNAHSKRVMAEDLAALMRTLGHERFLLAGHDRGARVAYRMAMDHPQAVQQLVSLDTIPTLDVWDAMDWRAALGAFHWPLLAQPYPLPETLISANPANFLDHLVDRWIGAGHRLHPSAMQAYQTAIEQDSVIRAMCEDYRSGATIDRAHDEADRTAGRRIGCPVLVLRGAGYQPEPLRPVWARSADDVHEVAIDCGHFIAEEASDDVSEAMQAFFGRGGDRKGGEARD